MLLCFYSLLFFILFNSNCDAAREVQKIDHPHIHLDVPKFHSKMGTKIHKMNAEKSVLYPFYKEDYMKEINSMKQMHDQPLPFRLPFYGFAYHYIWIHKDGYVAFNKGLKSYHFPLSFPSVPSDTRIEEDPSMIAAFFAHQDIPSDVEDAGVYFRLIELDSEDEEFRNKLVSDFQSGMVTSMNFDPTFAMIITWNNMTFANKRPDKELKTNTYQMIIATDEIYTYVMFNYEWITWITHLDNYNGLNGPAAFVGFNAGNSTRSYEFKPYSQNPRLSLLPNRGYGNGLLGRFYFVIDEIVYSGACVEKELDPNLPDRLTLTSSNDYVYNLGGNIINVTGPCLSPESVIYCRFDIWKVKGKFITKNIAACMVPPVMFEGYVDLTVTVDEKTFFYTRLYLQSAESRRGFDVQIVEEEIVEKLPSARASGDPNALTIKWNQSPFNWHNDAPLTISLWGYKEEDQVYPTLTFITELVTGIPNTGEYVLDLNSLPEIRISKYDFPFGFIGINHTGRDFTPNLWSKPLPLAWYMNPYWQREYGQNWQESFCSSWFDAEMEADRFALTVFRCPCTVEQSDYDRGRFAPDVQCNVIDKKCENLHHGALHCVRTARPSIGGSGQTCCYDDYGELLQTADTMYGGRPSRAFVYGKHPFKMRMMLPTLSYWLYDIMPFYYCCKWTPGEDNSDSCQKFNYWRTSQDCSSYQPPGIASIFGDPHMITFDRFNYTFEGKGEFVLVHADNPVHKLDVHGRFEQRSPSTNSTHLAAIAMRDNISSIVEFRIRPTAARWQYHMFIIADKEYYFFWDTNMRSINLRGVTLYQPAGIRNMSHVVAMFDSGAGVEVLVTPQGSLKLHVYLPNTYINITRGLLGKWSRDPFDDFEMPDGTPGPNPTALPMRDIYNHLSNHYRLTETAKPNIGQSLFFHDVVSHSHYDDKKFEPKFDVNLPPDSTIHEEDLDRVCSQSAACKYDYIITGDAGYAAQTKKDEAAAEIMFKEMSKKVIRCPALPKPKNGRKSENRYWPGTIVRFACDTGYRLIGYEVRRCREDGLWSWGVDAECIPDLTYKLTVAGIFIGVILPVVIILVLFFFCWKHENEKRKYFTEQKPVEYLPNKRPNETKILSSNSTSDLNTEYRTSDSIESRQHPSSYPGSMERTTTQPGHLV